MVNAISFEYQYKKYKKVNLLEHENKKIHLYDFPPYLLLQERLLEVRDHVDLHLAGVRAQLRRPNDVRVTIYSKK